jgi:hypothetical protein
VKDLHGNDRLPRLLAKSDYKCSFIGYLML